MELEAIPGSSPRKRGPGAKELDSRLRGNERRVRQLEWIKLQNENGRDEPGHDVGNVGATPL